MAYISIAQSANVSVLSKRKELAFSDQQYAHSLFFVQNHKVEKDLLLLIGFMHLHV